MDRQGRLLPHHAAGYAKLEKDVVISGAGRHVEVWNRDDFFRFIEGRHKWNSNIFPSCWSPAWSCWGWTGIRRRVRWTALGGGGTQEICRARAERFWASTGDWEALRGGGGALLAPFGGTAFVPLHGNYANIASLCTKAGYDSMDGMLMDPGRFVLSAGQPERGFSFPPMRRWTCAWIRPRR